jgi:hypothetical protein
MLFILNSKNKVIIESQVGTYTLLINLSAGFEFFKIK